MAEGEGLKPGAVTRQAGAVPTIPEGSNGLVEEVGGVSSDLYHPATSFSADG